MHQTLRDGRLDLHPVRATLQVQLFFLVTSDFVVVTLTSWGLALLSSLAAPAVLT